MSYINADKAWIRDLEHVFKFGHRSKPRNVEVAEVLGFQSVIEMSKPIIFNPERKLGYKFMAAEAAWILSGSDDVKSIAPYSQAISKFSDDGQTFFGAYGPKVLDQLGYCQSVIEQDYDTRQAVLNIWRENPPVSKDIPCTLSLQFLVRHGAIHCVANMRSSDLWLGHVYDIFNFSAITFALMLQLNVTRKERGDLPLVLGTLFLNAGSKHIYERNFEAVGQVIEAFNENGLDFSYSFKTPFEAGKYADANDFVGVLWQAADHEHGALSLIERI